MVFWLVCVWCEGCDSAVYCVCCELLVRCECGEPPLCDLWLVGRGGLIGGNDLGAVGTALLSAILDTPPCTVEAKLFGFNAKFCSYIFSEATLF